jgi:hypothetical protein
MSQLQPDARVSAWKQVAWAINDNVSGTELRVRIGTDLSTTSQELDDGTLRELANLVEGWLQGIESADQPFNEEDQTPMRFSRGGLDFSLTAHKRTPNMVHERIVMNPDPPIAWSGSAV